MRAKRISQIQALRGFLPLPETSASKALFFFFAEHTQQPQAAVIKCQVSVSGNCLQRDNAHHSERKSHPKAREIKQILLWMSPQRSCLWLLEMKHCSLLTPQSLERDGILSFSQKGALQEADYRNICCEAEVLP